jgi:tetratricopeptide (TPR) repeat protein
MHKDSNSMSANYNLDMVGVIEGTNKSSSFQSFDAAMDFLRHYERLFYSFREEPINLLEIGVAGGASLRSWKSYFTRACIVGIDANPQCQQFADDRVNIEIGSQNDPEFLTNVCAKYPPSIIIDDGSHWADHIMCSFNNMFPKLLAGGLYIIEDIAIHFGPERNRFKGDAAEWPSDYFMRIGRSLLALGRDGPSAGMERMREVDSVEFLRSALVVRKRPPPQNVGFALTFADEYMRDRIPGAEVHERLAQYIVKHEGPLDRAEAELKRALEKGGETPRRLYIYSQICRQLPNRLAEAAELAERAAGLANDARFWEHAGNLRLLLGEYLASSYAYRQAASMQPDNSVVAARLSRALELQGEFVEALAAAEQALSAAKGRAVDELRAHVERLREKVSLAT